MLLSPLLIVLLYRQRMRWLHSVIEATNMNLTQLREAVEDRRAWRALVHGVTKSRIPLNNYTKQKQIYNQKRERRRTSYLFIAKQQH